MCFGNDSGSQNFTFSGVNFFYTRYDEFNIMIKNIYRLYPYKSLLVYTSSEWMLYGIGTTHILDLYLEEFRNGRIFYGGGPEGYIGSKEAIYTEHEIFEMVKKIEYEFV